MKSINKSRLFLAACMALVVTSMTFALRAGMIKPLGAQFGLSGSDMGWIIGMSSLGFPIATTLGGFFVDILGMRRFIWLAVFAHVLGIFSTIFADGFWTLLGSTFLIGFANGTVEAVCNPLVASLYPENKTTMLNKFHVWFPGGIVLGSLVSFFMTESLALNWQWQVGFLLIPTALYAYLFYGQTFPPTERVSSGYSTGDMLAACFNPLFLFMAFCMFLTANTELATTQWAEKLLGNAGASGMLILALISGVMALGRFFGGPLIHRLNPSGILFFSAIISTIGIFWLRQAEGTQVYTAAVVFAVGVCYFWPTMLGFVSENIPKSGALGLSLMGGAGMLGNWAFQSFFLGSQIDAYANQIKSVSPGLDSKAVDLFAGKQILADLNFLPIILVAAFGGLYFFIKQKK
jgi:fucose permease